MKKNSAAVSMPFRVACLSDIFTPCKYITESEKAVDRHSKPKILNICTVVTNVHLPCLMMSVQGMTLVAFAVKGEAMDASPGLSMLSSASNESKYLANSSMRGVMVRPRARRASRFFWPLPIGFLFVPSEDATSVPEAPPLPALPPFPLALLSFFERFADSEADSSATPTCAAFSPPTSLVPSPHISSVRPSPRMVFTISSFCSGDTRA
mmetsp:Transcript_25167/g.68388  ORF Transcript_25167/g.68388 Transcript_25167/m.68388 type:complete len:209 (+) Transcript_25167:926-1552(+)